MFASDPTSSSSRRTPLRAAGSKAIVRLQVLRMLICAFPYAMRHFHHEPDGPRNLDAAIRLLRRAGQEVPEVTKACIRWMNQDLGPGTSDLTRQTGKGYGLLDSIADAAAIRS